MMEEILQPCPFCGGKAKIIGGVENWTPTSYDPDSGGDPIAVLCDSCECGLHYFEDYGEAIKAWNKRPLLKLRTNEDLLTPEEAIETINRLRKAYRKTREDMKYYLENNEENGVVYMPKFIIEKMIK